MTDFWKDWTNIIQLETKNITTNNTSSVHDTPAQASQVHTIMHEEPNNVGYKQCISILLILLVFKTFQISALNTVTDELRKTETMLTFLYMCRSHFLEVL